MPTTGSGIGSTPFGVGTPAVAQVPPANAASFTRYLNPGTGDIEIDSTTKHFRSMPRLRQRVLIIARTFKGSSTVLPDMGIARVDKVSPKRLSALRSSVRQAYRQLTDVEKVMRLDGIDIEHGPTGRLTLTIRYTDLETGTGDAAATPIG